MKNQLKKIIFLFAVSVISCMFLSAQNLSGKKIAILEPKFDFGSDTDNWIPLFVQGQVASNFQNYSGMTVIDRQNINKTIEEQKLSSNVAYSEDNDIEIGKLVVANYIVVISIIKMDSSYMIDAKINDVEKGTTVGKAYSNPNCPADKLEDGVVLYELTYELLAGLGIPKKDLEGLKDTKKIEQQKKEITKLKKESRVETGADKFGEFFDEFTEIEEAANNGDANAKFKLAEAYFYGRGTGVDFEKAFNLYNEVKQKIPAANSGIAVCYLRGNGVEKDVKKGLQMLKKQAKAGEPKAQYELGWCYSQGLYGTRKEFKTKTDRWRESFNLDKKSAAQGNGDGMFELGIYYEQGTEGVCEKDAKKAFTWYKKSADTGCANGYFGLSVCYYNAVGVAQDFSLGDKYLKMAVQGGSEEAKIYSTDEMFRAQAKLSNNPIALFLLGGFDNYLKSAKDGYTPAYLEVAKKYDIGDRGVPENKTEAISWRIKYVEEAGPSEGGNVENEIAYAYYYGRGVIEDREKDGKAVYWYKKAADAGNAEAINKLKSYFKIDYIPQWYKDKGL